MKEKTACRGRNRTDLKIELPEQPAVEEKIARMQIHSMENATTTRRRYAARAIFSEGKTAQGFFPGLEWCSAHLGCYLSGLLLDSARSAVRGTSDADLFLPVVSVNAGIVAYSYQAIDYVPSNDDPALPSLVILCIAPMDE